MNWFLFECHVNSNTIEDIPLIDIYINVLFM